MKNFTIALYFALLAISATAQNCPAGNVQFSTQAELDNFAINYPGCAHIAGSVLIHHLPVTANLDALSSITVIDGDLRVDSTYLLNLSGLQNLTTIRSHLCIDSNYVLSSLTGLEGLTSIQGRASIKYNPQLSGITGLNNLNTIGWFLLVTDNQALTSLTGLNNLKNAGLIYIRHNDGLKSLEGLNALTTVEGRLDISNNKMLTSLDGLNGISYIGEDLSVYENLTLTSLEALEGLDSIGGSVGMTLNAALTNLKGLEGLNSIGGSLHISDNDALTSLTGLDSIKSIGKEVRIIKNLTLRNLAGLGALTTIGGGLHIYQNTGLSNLDALINLKTIGTAHLYTNELHNGEIQISSNDSLTSLNGIDNIDYTTITYLNLWNSGRLSHCHIPNICNYLANPDNPAFISFNFPSCYNRIQIEQACAGFASTSMTEIGEGNFRIFPNPTTGAFEINTVEDTQGTIQLFDNTGRLLKTQAFSSSTQLDISDLPNGLYFLKIQTEHQAILKRIIKE